MKCKSCGAEVSEQSSFCSMCGHDLRGIIDGDQEFTQKIELCKVAKVLDEMNEFSENINSGKNERDQEFTQIIDISKKTKVTYKFMKKFSENINLGKIRLAKKTKELHKLMKKFSVNIHSSKIVLAKKIKELLKLMKKFTKNINSNVLVIVDGWTWVTEGNYTYVCGSVKNIGNRAINYFEVNVKYEDVNKNVLDSDFTNWNRKIQPGECKEFEIKHHLNKKYQFIDILVSNHKFF